MDLLFYLRFWKKQRKKFSPKSWFQKIAYHSLLPQPIPGLDVYKEKLPLKTVTFRKLVFLLLCFCLSSTQETWEENRRVGKVTSGIMWAKGRWGYWKPIHTWKLQREPSKASRVRLRSGFWECTCLERCWEHRKICFPGLLFIKWEWEVVFDQCLKISR